MEPSSFLIIGDSWGCGEWQHHSAISPPAPPPGILHKGLEQYLIDAGHLVQNHSIGGSSNYQSISILKSLDLYKFNNIIWFQTDPIRDVADDPDLVDYRTFFNEINSYQRVVEFQKELLLKTYSKLNALGFKILCIGGCSKLDLDLIKSFPNLNPIIPSVIEFLIPDFNHPETWFSGSRWYLHIDRQFSIDCIDKFLYNKQLQHDLEKYPDLFWPDGRHPNRNGHRKIFEYLNENLS